MFATSSDAAAGSGRLARRPLWLILLLVALAARAQTFGNPILHVDEEFYFAAARMIGHGALPFVDVWDRKPIGLFLVYVPAALLPLPWGTYAYQAMALAAVVATALVIVRLARLAGWQRGALAAAILYILWLDLPDGQGGQSPVFYNLLMALAALGTMRAAEMLPGRGLRVGAGAMLLVGLALQIKYAVVFEGCWFGAWLLWQGWRRGAGWPALLALTGALGIAALLPTALVAGLYAALGHEQAFLFANFVSILRRNSDQAAELLGNLRDCAVILAPLLALAAAGNGGDTADPTVRMRRRFLRGWLVAAVIGFLLFGSWFNHYTLPVLLPAALCAGAIVDARRRGGLVALVAIVLVAVAGQIVLLSERHMRGNTAAFDRIVADIASAPPGALYVYSGSSMFYAASGRPVLTPYLFPPHLQSVREAGAIGVDQTTETLRILAQRPAVVVVQTFDGGELPEPHGLIMAWLTGAHYVQVDHVVIGDHPVDVFRAPTSSPRSAASR